MPKIVCLKCGTDTKNKYRHKVYCSKKCKDQAHTISWAKMRNKIALLSGSGMNLDDLTKCLNIPVWDIIKYLDHLKGRPYKNISRNIITIYDFPDTQEIDEMDIGGNFGLPLEWKLPYNK